MIFFTDLMDFCHNSHMCSPLRVGMYDLDSQKRSEELQIIVELALIEHAHLGRTFRASFVHRTVAMCHR